MKNVETIPQDPVERLNEVIDLSWKIFKSQFLNKRHEINKEAPFQHHFAQIISSIGQLFCTKRDEVFFVDLETKFHVEGLNANSYIDITCEFGPSGNEKLRKKAAIELKFKTARQSAQDSGRIDAFKDIQSLEVYCQHGYNFGRFFMITDSHPYVGKSTIGVGTQFTTYHGAKTVAGAKFNYTCKGKEDINVHLKNPYEFSWEKENSDEKNPWYFLDLGVNAPENT